MYCPECGNNAGDANFCAECGAELKAADDAVCPDCGAEVDDAKFCPECGADLRGAGNAARPQGGGSAARRTTASAGARRTGAPRKSPPRQQSRPAPAPTKAASKSISPLIIWGGFGIAAVIVVLVIVLAAGGGGTSGAGATTGSSQAVQPVAADTSGSYGELVQRANGLYDQGAAAFQAQKNAQAVADFQAAAKVYAAAWKKQSTDPNVGTDYATSLYYSGQIDAAVKQVDRVLAKSPGFQTAWFNKGNYLAEKASQAEQSGQSKAAKAAYTEARAAYTKAIAIDGGSQVAGQAKQRLDQLPQ